MKRTADEVGTLASDLGAVEDWLRDSCEARHAERMADLIGRACQVLEDFYDQLFVEETGKP